MWGVKKGADVPNSQKLQTLFSISEKIEEGKIYGDIASQNERIL